jgi:hypothetical protein
MTATLEADHLEELNEKLNKIKAYISQAEPGKERLSLVQLTLPTAHVENLLVVLRWLLYSFVGAMGIVFILSHFQILPIRPDISGIGLFLGLLFLLGVHLESLYWYWQRPEFDLRQKDITQG